MKSKPSPIAKLRSRSAPDSTATSGRNDSATRDSVLAAIKTANTVSAGFRRSGKNVICITWSMDYQACWTLSQINVKQGGADSLPQGFGKAFASLLAQHGPVAARSGILLLLPPAEVSWARVRHRSFFLNPHGEL
jgi:hypothetical protein